MRLPATLSERVHDTSRRAGKIARSILTRRLRPYSGPVDLPPLVVAQIGRATKNRRLALLLPGPDATGLTVAATRGYSGEDLSVILFARDGPLFRHFSVHPYPAHCSQLARMPWFGLMEEAERKSLSEPAGATISPLIDRGYLAALMAFDAAPASRPVGRPVPQPIAVGPTSSERDGWFWGTALAKAPVPRTSTFFPLRETALGRENVTRAFHETLHDLNNVFTGMIARSQIIEASATLEEVGAIREMALRGADSVRRLRGASRSSPMRAPGSLWRSMTSFEAPWPRSSLDGGMAV